MQALKQNTRVLRCWYVKVPKDIPDEAVIYF